MEMEVDEIKKVGELPAWIKKTRNGPQSKKECRAIENIVGKRSSRCKEAAIGKSFCAKHKKYAKMHKKYKELEAKLNFSAIVPINANGSELIAAIIELRENVALVARCEQLRDNYMQKCIARECWDAGHLERIRRLRELRERGEKYVLTACTRLRAEMFANETLVESYNVVDAVMDIESVEPIVPISRTITEKDIVALEDFSEFTIDWWAEQARVIREFVATTGMDELNSLVALVYKIHLTANDLIVEDTVRHDYNMVVAAQLVLAIIHVNFHEDKPNTFIRIPEFVNGDAAPSRPVQVIMENVDLFLLERAVARKARCLLPSILTMYQLMPYDDYVKKMKEVIATNDAKKSGSPKVERVKKILDVCPVFNTRIAAAVFEVDPVRMRYAGAGITFNSARIFVIGLQDSVAYSNFLFKNFTGSELDMLLQIFTNNMKIRRNRLALNFMNVMRG